MKIACYIQILQFLKVDIFVRKGTNAIVAWKSGQPTTLCSEIRQNFSTFLGLVDNFSKFSLRVNEFLCYQFVFYCVLISVFVLNQLMTTNWFPCAFTLIYFLSAGIISAEIPSSLDLLQVKCKQVGLKSSSSEFGKITLGDMTSNQEDCTIMCPIKYLKLNDTFFYILEPLYQIF